MRKLAASFSIESAQDIRAMHGIDIEREMIKEYPELANDDTYNKIYNWLINK